MALSGQGHNWDNRYSWSLPVSSWAAWRRGEEWPCGCGQGSEGAEGEARLLGKEAPGCFLLVVSPGRTWGPQLWAGAGSLGRFGTSPLQRLRLPL